MTTRGDLSQRSVVLIAEMNSAGSWDLTAVDGSTEAIVDRFTLGLELADDVGSPRWATKVLAASREHTVSAIVLFSPPPSKGEPLVTGPIATDPVPILMLPTWLALAHALPNTVRRIVVVNTEGPGFLRLVSRLPDDTFEFSDDIAAPLTPLLTPPSFEVELDGDCLLASLSSRLKQRAAGHSLVTFSSLAQSRPEVLDAELGVVLETIAKVLSAARLLTDWSVVLWTGPSARALGGLLEQRLAALLAPDGHRAPEIWVPVEPSRRCIGGARFAKRVTETSGVWRQRAGARCTFRLIAKHPIDYSIVHTSRPAFHPEDDTIRRCVEQRPVLAVVDRHVEDLYGPRIRAYLQRHVHCLAYVVVDGAERNKTWDCVEDICRTAIESGLGRHGFFMAVGGGVTLDVVGLAAALFRRGSSYLRVPTTLIGMVDVAVGIKQGVNVGSHKNILGAFFPPVASVIDPTFLKTLSARDIACGIAEILKMGLVCDARLFDLLHASARELATTRFETPAAVAEEVLTRAEVSMMEQLCPNLFERDLRRLVDFGHSFSPAIEASSGYEIPHGEAVGLDMALCTHIAAERRLCDWDLLDQVVHIYRAVGLPLSQTVCASECLWGHLNAIRAHRGGELNLVVPRGIGAAEFIQDVREEEIGRAVRYFQARGRDAEALENSDRDAEDLDASYRL